MPTFRRAGQGNIQQRLRQHSTCELVAVAITNLALHTTPPSLSQSFKMANGYVLAYNQRPHIGTDFHNSWSLLVSVIFIVVFCAVAWFASPKGENQTYVFSLTYLLECAPAQTQRYNRCAISLPSRNT
jgi:hypothetical protein